MKKNKKEVIPTSNYIKLIFIIIVTVIITIALRNAYISNKNYENEIPVIRDYIISEINSSEVYNYIRENENTILYIGSSDSTECRNLEEKLKDVIDKRNLTEKITYVNITKEKKKASFIKEFNKFYDTKVLGYPSFIIFNDGKVVDILTVKEKGKLTIKEVTEFLDSNKVYIDSYD